MQYSDTYIQALDIQTTDGQSVSNNKSNASTPNSTPGKPKQGQAPILLAVPTPGVPRRRHSWICG